MPLESATYISQLDAANPTGTDPKSQGDDQIRLVKAVLKAQFPAFGAAALASSTTQLDKVVSTINISSSAPANSQYIDASGNVGIGGAAGLTERMALFTPNGTRSVIRFSQASQRDWYVGIPANKPYLAFTDASINQERMVIDVDGKVNIGRNDGIRTFNVRNTANSFTDVSIQSNSNNGSPGLSTIYFGNLNNDSKGYISYDTLNSSFLFGTEGFGRAAIDASGVFTYGGLEIGYRDIPRVTGGVERGKCFSTASGFTLNTGLAAGSALSIYNNSASSITVTAGAGLTLRLAGTGTTGSRTIAARGMATVWAESSTEYIMSGAGVS